MGTVSAASVAASSENIEGLPPSVLEELRDKLRGGTATGYGVVRVRAAVRPGEAGTDGARSFASRGLGWLIILQG